MKNFKKSVIKFINKPASNFLNKISTWSGILTGIVSLIVSFVALKISIEQQHDRTQLKSMTEMITRLDKQIKATDELTQSNLYQNRKIDKQLAVTVEQSIKNSKQVDFLGQLFKISRYDDITKERGEKLKFTDGLGEIYTNVSYTIIFSRMISSFDTLSVEDTEHIKFIDSLCSSTEKLMKTQRFNPLVLNNEKNSTEWNNFLNSTHNFHRYICEKNLTYYNRHRIDVLTKYEEDCIVFFSNFRKEYFSSVLTKFINELDNHIIMEKKRKEFQTAGKIP